jgi:hypothetical protein
MNQRKRFIRAAWHLGAVVLIAAAVGCGGKAGALGKLKHKPAPQNALSISAQQSTLAMPESAGFNYVYQNSGQQPAGHGVTRGETKLDKAGTVTCQAECHDGENAFAEFQLGADFRTELGQPTPAVVRWLIEYAHQVIADPADDDQTEASFSLVLIVRDDKGRILAETAVKQLSSQDGGRTWSGHEEQAFHVTLEPDRRYYAILAGRADAKAREGTSARSRIECRKTSLDVQLQPES